MADTSTNAVLPPATVPVLDMGSNSLTLPWRRALQNSGASAAGGITQLTGDVLAGPGGGVQTALLSPTGVTPGAYVAVSLTVDAAGRISLIENGVDAVAALGFGFEAQGIIADNEQIGFASWPVDVTFTVAEGGSYLNAFASTPATADAVFQFFSDTLTLLGTFTVLAGQTSGALAWTMDPYIHPANTFLLVHGPTPADATLGNVNALIVGKAA